MGDFYEMFLDDALIAARILDITLTSRNKNSADEIPFCGVPFHSAQPYIARLVEAKVLAQTTVGKRNRAFEAPEVIDAFTDLERQLASPAGDTQIAPPARRVPRRRQGR